MKIEKIPWQWPRTNGFDVAISVLNNPKEELLRDESFFEKLVFQADNVVSRSFGACLEGCDSTREHLLDIDAVSFAYSEEKILGFASAKVIPKKKLFFLHGVVVDPEIKAMGVGGFLVKSLLKDNDDNDFDWISFTTQNPVMFQFLKSLCNGNVIPSPDGISVPENLKSLAKELIKNREGIFNEETLVIEGLYKKCLYDEIPTSSDTSTQNWFEESLCFDENRKSNHGFLFFGKLN
jgi:hypothetical protein